MSEEKEKYYAFKGFDENLKCRDEQFTVGVTYSKDVLEPENIRTCSNQGWHYCDTLEDVFSWYSNDGKNRFCKVEILGKHHKDKYDNKCITTSFKIIEEISPRELDELNHNKAIEQLPLEIMQKLQKAYPIFFGGSAALLLYGAKLKRKYYRRDGLDLDIISPYYIKVTKKSLEDVGLDIKEVKDHGGKASGNDFDETISIYFNTSSKTELYKAYNDLDGYLKLDIKIDPKQSYNVVQYKDNEYRLSQIESIIEAKCRYAMNGQHKHKYDLYDILGVDSHKIQ